MNFFLISILGLVFAATVAAIFSGRKRSKAYLCGISLWCKFLPLATILIYMLLLGSNLAAGYMLESFSLASLLSVQEMVVMFLAGPMFLTRAGNLIGLSTLVYLINKIGFSESLVSGHGIFTLVISVTTITILADKMPWHPQKSYGFQAQRIRDLSLVLAGFLSLALIFLTLLKLKSLGFWLDRMFLLQLPKQILFAALASVFLGWLGIILGIGRTFLVFLICIPTCIALAFITNWSSSLVAIPFAGLLSLALASADQNLNRQRRQS